MIRSRDAINILRDDYKKSVFWLFIIPYGTEIMKVPSLLKWHQLETKATSFFVLTF